MKNTEITRERLTGELAQARQRITELEELLADEERAQSAIQEAREYAESIVATVREPLLVLDTDLRVVSANRAFYLTFGVKPEETRGSFIYDLGNGQWDIPRLRELLEEILPGNTSFYDFEVEHNFPSLGHRVMMLNARRLYRETKKTRLILLAIQDVTENKQAKERLSVSETRYRRLFETAQDGILILDADTGKIADVNPFLIDMLGYSREEFMGKRLWEIGPFKDIEASQEAFQELQSKGYVRYEHLPLETKNGQHISVEFVSNVYPINGDRVIQCNIRDITERVRAEAELRDYKDQLEKIVEERTAELQKANRKLQKDITQRKKAEKALKESERRYRELARSISDTFFAMNEDLRYIYWNEACEELTGISAKAAQGKHLYDIFPRDEQTKKAEEVYLEVLRRKRPQYFTIEHRVGSKDCVFEISAYPSKDGVSVLVKDITERRKLEQALQLAEQNFRNSLDASPLGIRIVTTEGKLLYANQAILDIYGYSSVEELRTTPAKQRYTPESYAEHQKRKEARRLGQPTPSNYEIAIVRKDGEIRQLSVLRREVIWNGEPQFQAVYEDITERRRIEDKLRQSESKYRTLIERLQEGVYQADLYGNYVTLNQAGANILGFDSPEEVIGKWKTVDFYSSSDRAKITKGVREVGFWKGEVRARRQDGTAIWLQANSSATLDALGNIIGYEGTFSDITEAKQAENREREVASLKELDQMRTNLLARVSHELRTPLATIKGYATMLLDYDERLGFDEKRKYLESVDRACDRLTTLVDSLLDMSRLETGLLRLEKAPIHISVLIKEIIADCQLREPKHKIVGDVREGLPKVVVDSKRIRQVIDNLVNNACKFSEEGTEVVISAKLAGQELIISVADHGIGIPAEDLDKVFGPVYPNKQGLGGKKGGLGLGLSISKGLVEAHGGRIWMESKVGQGTICSFALPV